MRKRTLAALVGLLLGLLAAPAVAQDVCVEVTTGPPGQRGDHCGPDTSGTVDSLVARIGVLEADVARLQAALDSIAALPPPEPDTVFVGDPAVEDSLRTVIVQLEAENDSLRLRVAELDAELSAVVAERDSLAAEVDRLAALLEEERLLTAALEAELTVVRDSLVIERARADSLQAILDSLTATDPEPEPEPVDSLAFASATVVATDADSVTVLAEWDGAGTFEVRACCRTGGGSWVGSAYLPPDTTTETQVHIRQVRFDEDAIVRACIVQLDTGIERCDSFDVPARGTEPEPDPGDLTWRFRPLGGGWTSTPTATSWDGGRTVRWRSDPAPGGYLILVDGQVVRYVNDDECVYDVVRLDDGSVVDQCPADDEHYVALVSPATSLTIRAVSGTRLSAPGETLGEVVVP